MPYKEHAIEKIYWSMEEAAAEIGIATSKIRFYETELGMHIGRHGRNGVRMLRSRDIEFLKAVVRLRVYLSVRGIKELNEQGKLDQIDEILK